MKKTGMYVITKNPLYIMVNLTKVNRTLIMVAVALKILFLCENRYANQNILEHILKDCSLFEKDTCYLPSNHEEGLALWKLIS